MAHGCALICSTHGALPEVAGDAALYLRSADPQALADLIVRIFKDDALRTTLQSAARERARTVCGQALAYQEQSG